MNRAFIITNYIIAAEVLCLVGARGWELDSSMHCIERLGLSFAYGVWVGDGVFVLVFEFGFMNMNE